MSGEYGLKQPTAIARDSISSINQKSLHSIGDSVQGAIVHYDISVVSSDTDARFHFTDSTGSTKLWTIPCDNTKHVNGTPHLTPDAIHTSVGQDVGIEIDGNSNATVVVSTVIAERA